MEVLSEAPHTGSFVPLAEHQSATPASFHSGPPVLHYYSDRCKLIVLADELQNAPALSSFASKASAPAHTNEQQATEQINGSHATQKTLEEIDIWVTSEYETLLHTQTAANIFQQAPILLQTT